MAQPFQNHANNSINSYNHNNNSSFNTTINRPRNTPTQPPKPSKPQIDAQTIFHDPTSSTDPRWYWRITMEASRKDPRNMKYYTNYVGSKGARSFENNSNSSNKKPDHYKKHLAKIGCPLHDLYDIFHKDLRFTVHPTICAHKSWKCPSFSSYSKHNVLATISMNDIGLEWKRGAFSVKPLHIEYNNTFSTDLYIKRIANTNFNKVFRPGCFGNLPSVKKGSWKQGKVFYVFKNDKLVFNIGNNIILIFELSSPSTIIKSSKNKHDIIDGWKNIVGGVGFYACSETQQNIATVLILRKSTEFPIECIQQSKIKILVKGTHFSGKKLIIGSKTFALNARCRNNDLDNDYSSMSTSSSHSPFVDERKQSDEKLHSIINSQINRMKNKFDRDNSILLQRNQLLNGKINQLQTINKQFMELNSQLMQERDQLVNQLHTFQNRQLIHNPPPIPQPQPVPQPQIVMNNYNNVTHATPMMSTHINSNTVLVNNDRRGRDRDRNMRFNTEHNGHGSRSRSRDRINNESNVNEGSNMINVDGYGNESPGYSGSDRSVRSWSTVSNEASCMNNYGINTNISSVNMISMEPNISSPFYMNINEMDNNSMYMDMNNMNFNHSTSPRALMNGMNDNNSIMNDPMFYGTYTD